MKYYIAILLCAAFLTSCGDDNEYLDSIEKEEVSNQQIALTEPVQEVGITYAILSGQVNFEQIPVGSSFVGVGFELSTDKDFATECTKRISARAIEGNKLTIKIDTLSPQTTYYHRIVVVLNNLDCYGASQSFTTRALNIAASAGEISNVTLTSAKVDYEVKLGNLSKSETVVAGIAYAEEKRHLQADSIIANFAKNPFYIGPVSNDLKSTNIIEKRCSQLTGGSIKELISGLKPGRTYYYCTYIRAANEIVTNEVREFSTIDFPEQQIMDCETNDVTLASATIIGKTSIEGRLKELYPDGRSFFFGINYAKEAEYANGITYSADFNFNDNKYIFQLSRLTPNTTYVYYPYVRIDNSIIAGNVKQFKTKPLEDYISFSVVDDEIGFSSAIVSGKTMLKGLFQNTSYTLHYVNAANSWDYEGTMSVIGDSLTGEMRSLACGNTYNYWITINADDQVLQTEKKSFKSKDPKDYIYLSDATSITSSEAEITCSVDPKVYEGSISCHVIYGLSKENISSYAQMSTVDSKTVKATLNNLSSGTTYYYYAMVLFTTGLGWADWYSTDIKTFTTK